MKKRLLSILLAICMIVSLAPSVLAADADLTISDEAGLKAFAEDVNGGNDYAGKTVVLANSITLIGEWTPIGTEDHPFSGVFDGGGHTITGLTNTAFVDVAAGSDLCLGLFGYVSGTANSSYTATDDIWNGTALVETAIAESKYTSVIKNLTLTDVTINGNGSWVGALVGGVYHTYIADVTVSSGSVKGQNSVGGVIGRGYGTILKNVVTGNALTVGSSKSEGSNYYNYGGIVGALRADFSSLSAAINCTNNAAVSAYVTAGGIAGVVGQFNNPLVLYGCENNGAITVTTATSVKPIEVMASGIGGQCNGSGVIANCTNNGVVSSTKENSAVSAFVASGGGNGSVSATYLQM